MVLHKDKESFDIAIRAASRHFNVSSAIIEKADDLKRASILDFKDYEAAIQSAQANRIKANYIITRNIMDYNRSKVTAIKPSELIERI